jgi:PAS domain S-box-containing protein
VKENGWKNRRILVIDDNEAIHKDFREILGTADTDTAALDEAKAAILGAGPEAAKLESFEIDSAFQGQEGLERVRQALHEGWPYAMAFVDVRMPPGWDGIETVRQIWAEYPQLEVVICTAYSDYQWQDIIDMLGQTDQLLILKKPFDNVEVRQLACALTEKWSLARQAESALGESKEKYRKLFGEAIDAIFVADAETGIIIDCNPAAARLVGREKTELVGQHQRILHPSEEIEGQFSKTFKQHIREKQGESLETKVITKEGQKRDVAIKASVFELGGKRVIQGTFRDITDRKKAEQAIRQSEHFLEHVLNSIQDGISVLDPELNIVRVNDAMRLLYGHMLPLESKKCYHAYHGRSEPCEVCPTRRALQTGKLEMEEVLLTQADGVTGTLELFDFPILDDNGRTTGVVEYVRDITDRKHAEEELKEQDRLKSELVMNVSHELRTPLTIFKNIISNVLAGVMGQLNDKQRETLEIADREIDRLARIIGDFLDISKIETGKTKLNLAPLTIQSIVTETVNTRRVLLDDKNVELRASMPDNDLYVNADRDRIAQVLANLIDNAIKFAPGCGGCITIRVKDLEDEVGIDVQDNGPGIEADDINKVFNRFVQIEKHVGPGSHGTGLGLAICKELIELHGGRIWAENVPTGGINFCLVLPKSSPDFKNQHKTGDDCEHLPSSCSQHEM